MKKYLILITILFAAFCLTAKVSLKTALKIATLKESLIKNAEIDREIARLNKSLKKKEKSIVADFNASYMFRSEKIEIKFPETNPVPGVTVPGMSFNAGSLHNFDLNLGLRKPLFSGNLISNSIKIAEKKSEVADFSKDIIKFKVIFRVKSSYIRYMLLNNTLETLKVVKERLVTHLKRLRDLKKETLVSDSDILNAEMRMGEIELEINGVRAAMSVEDNLFKKLCKYSIEEVKAGYREKVLSKKKSLDWFLGNHPLLKIYDKRREQSYIEERIVAGSYLPFIGLFSELHYGKPGINFFENRWKFYVQAGLKVSLKLFDSDKKGVKKRIIAYGREKLKNDRRDLILKLKENLDDLYEKIDIYSTNLRIAEALGKKSETESLLKKELYFENEIPGSEYLDSLLNIKKYKIKKIEIKLNLEMAKIAVNNLIGREVINEI